MIEIKAKKTDTMREKLTRSKSAIFVDFTGLNVASEWELRRLLRHLGGEYKVFKNTLTRRAVQDVFPEVKLNGVLEKPTAFVLSYDDPLKTFKPLAKFIHDHDGKPAVKGLILEGAFVKAAQFKSLSKFESKATLIADMLGSLNSQPASLVGCLQSLLAQLAGVLEAISQMETKRIKEVSQ
ncbi:MAG: 50S ribosomal protein L10 [bacterium]